MKLTNHIWSIWNIGRENGNADIGVAKDMFIANLEQKKAAYHGADELDYEALGAAWDELSLEEKTAQREAYGAVTRSRYKDLTAARREDDRETFERVVAETVAALETPEEEVPAEDEAE